MTESGQTERTQAPDKARGQKAILRQHLKVASFNVRTLNGAGKLHQLTTGCERVKINIMAIQEHRQIFASEISEEWTQDGKWLKILASANEAGVGGIGLVIERNLASLLQPCIKVSNRIIVTHLNGNPRISLIAIYAPTDCADEEEKGKFYTELKSTLETIPIHNIAIVLGDFNARIGYDSHITMPNVVGRNTFHQHTNDNGQRLIDTCQSFNLRPALSRFPHRLNRLWTW